MSRAYGCTLVPLHRPSWPQIWEFRPLWTVKKVLLHHGWGWYPPQTASYILIRHIQSVWAVGMLFQGHMVALLYRYTGQVGPRFGKAGSLVEWKWCHNVMVEADIHLRLLHTSILDTYKVFKSLVCCMKGVWVQPHTVTLAKLAPDLGSKGHLGVKMMPQCHGWGWYSLQTTSYIHIRHIQSVWDIGMLSQGHMVAHLYCYTGQVAPRSWDSGTLEEWKWCHDIIVEADIHVRLLHTSILDIYKVFESLVSCLKGIWVHPYTITPAKLPPDLGIQVHLGVEMMPQRHGWGWYSPQTTSYIHIRHMKSVWAIGMLSEGHMVAPLCHYTGQVGPRFGDSGSLEEWKWCHNVMVEADIHVRLLHTSILDIYKSVWAIGMLSQGHMGAASYRYTGQVGPRFGKYGSLRSENDATTSWLRLIFTSDRFIHPY